MQFNGDKFEALRYWPDKASKPETVYPEEKSTLRDLGVELGHDCSFSVHIEKTVAAGNGLLGFLHFLSSTAFTLLCFNVPCCLSVFLRSGVFCS